VGVAACAVRGLGRHACRAHHVGGRAQGRGERRPTAGAQVAAQRLPRHPPLCHELFLAEAVWSGDEDPRAVAMRNKAVNERAGTLPYVTI